MARPVTKKGIRFLERGGKPAPGGERKRKKPKKKRR